MAFMVIAVPAAGLLLRATQTMILVSGLLAKGVDSGEALGAKDCHWTPPICSKQSSILLGLCIVNTGNTVEIARYNGTFIAIYDCDS